MTLAERNILVSAQLKIERDQRRTSFAAGNSRSSKGTGTGFIPCARPGAALHDRPNNDTDCKRIPDFHTVHGDGNARA